MESPVFRRVLIALMAGAGVGLVALLGATLYGTLTAPRAGVAVREITREQIRRRSDERVARLAAGAPIESLTQLGNGPGVVVCEPVAMRADSHTADFGDGCGRWLNFVLAGHGEFGKTPLWTSVDRARRQLRRRNLRLSLREASRVAPSLGISHAVTGEISGGTSQMRLRYQVWELANRRAVGTPVRISGSRAAVTPQLPAMARDLVARLGAPTDRTPGGTDLTPGDLQFLGQLPWHPGGRSCTASQLGRLRILGRRSVFAEFLYLLHALEPFDFSLARGLVDDLTARRPAHPLIVGETAVYFSWNLFPEGGFRWPAREGFQREVDEAVRRFPVSYLLVLGTYFAPIWERKPESARRVAEHAVRCSARNPDAWLLLHNCIHEQIEGFYRRPNVGYSEQPIGHRALVKLYGDAFQVAAAAVRLNHSDPEAFITFSRSAASVGDRETAHAAFSRAFRLDPASSDVYDWEFEMLEPRWFGPDRPAHRRLANQAARMLFETPFERVRMASILDSRGYKQLAWRVLRTRDERERFSRFLRDEF